MDPQRQPRVLLTPHLMFGLMFIYLGVVLTVDRLNIDAVEGYIRYWPAGLIVLGLAKLWQVHRGHGSPIGGVMFAGIGSWMLLDTLDVVSRSIFDFWPLMLVFVGAMIVWQGLRGRRDRGGAPSHDTVNAVAILSGVKRGSNSTAFRGGELSAFMGGCEVDLRQAAINGDATLDVFAMWGGIEIRVPENWTIIGQVTPLLGGFEDQTGAPPTATAHRLTVRGMVVMGGVEIKH
jgi:hypothetical protein